jgi:hypothetical protein
MRVLDKNFSRIKKQLPEDVGVVFYLLLFSQNMIENGAMPGLGCTYAKQMAAKIAAMT